MKTRCLIFLILIVQKLFKFIKKKLIAYIYLLEFEKIQNIYKFKYSAACKNMGHENNTLCFYHFICMCTDVVVGCQNMFWR